VRITHRSARSAGTAVMSTSNDSTRREKQACDYPPRGRYGARSADTAVMSASSDSTRREKQACDYPPRGR
jgi:hypothetical protein